MAYQLACPSCKSVLSLAANTPGALFVCNRYGRKMQLPGGSLPVAQSVSGANGLPLPRPTTDDLVGSGTGSLGGRRHIGRKLMAIVPMRIFAQFVAIEVFAEFLALDAKRPAARPEPAPEADTPIGRTPPATSFCFHKNSLHFGWCLLSSIENCIYMGILRSLK